MNSVFPKGLAVAAVALGMCLSACASYQELNGAQFDAKLHPAIINSAEAWRLVSEDDEFYYLEDQLVVDVHYYKVPKREVTIDVGPNPKLPVNLKLDEVKTLSL